MAKQKNECKVTLEELNKIEARHTAAAADLTQYYSNIDTAYRYSVPQRRIYLDAQNKLRSNPEIYDDTAVVGVQKFATKMQSMLVPSWQRWMRYEAGSGVAEEEKAGVQEEFDAYTSIFFDELQRSNFDMQCAESFQDLAVTTGAIIINPSPVGAESALTFKAIPINELSFEESEDGIIRNVWRQFEIRINEIKDRYSDAELSPEDIMKADKDPTTKVTLVEATVHEQKTNSFKVLLYNPSKKYIYLTRYEKVSPFIVFRENVVSGAALGFGRVMRVLPSIKTLNMIKKLTLQAGSIAVSGTFTAHDDGVLNPYAVRLAPGVTIPVNSNDSRNPSIARLDTPTNFDWSSMESAELKAVINEALMANPYGAINDTPVRSATEITARNSEIFYSVSSSLGRMQREFIAPLIKRSTYVLQRAGVMEEFELDNVNVRYKFISPYAKLQASTDIENVVEWMGIVGTLGEEVSDMTVKKENIPGWLGKQYGIPQELMRSPEETQQSVQTANQMEAAKMAAQQGAVDPMMAGGIAPQVVGDTGGAEQMNIGIGGIL